MNIKGFVLTFFVFSSVAWGKVEHELVRRLAVFPFQVDSQYQSMGEKAWWDVRDLLAKDRRFLIASKRFMVKRDVYGAHSELKLADAILLGKVLEADALIVTSLKKKNLNMKVYDGRQGILLWKQDLRLHPAIPISDQIKEACLRLTKDFIASIPYQGFHKVDPLVGKPIYEENFKQYAKVSVSLNSGVEVEDTVQWIEVYGDLSAPLFAQGGEVKVIAEGKVVHIESGLLTVEVKRAKKINALKEGALIRIPKIAKKLSRAYAIQRGKTSSLTQYVAKDMKEVKEEGNVDSLTASLAFLTSLAAMILFIF